MDMQSACQLILGEVDGSLGCMIIDMQSGLTVAAEYRQGSLMSPATINLVAVVSTNMFHGKLIAQFEAALTRPARGQARTGFVREVQMATEQTNQFMAAIPGWEQGLLVLVTDKTVSVGLGWMAVHRAIGHLGISAQPQQPSVTASAPPHAPPPHAPPPMHNPAPVAEPHPDANRYAPPQTPMPPPIAASPAAGYGPQQGEPPPRTAQTQPEAAPKDQPTGKKRPVAMGARVMFGRK